MIRRVDVRNWAGGCLAGLLLCVIVQAQSVGLPQPRLLITHPLGGKVGSEIEVRIEGEHLDEGRELVFSDKRLTATPKLDAAGNPVPATYLVKIAEDCPVGIYEARVMTRLGLSTSRIFSVGTLEEVQQKSPNTTLATATPLPMNSVCNANMSVRAVDYYSFTGKQGQRVIVDCATQGIDSKLKATVILADAQGRDLLVERGGAALDFTIPADGTYVIKIHELTFKGGHGFFYRLGLWEQAPGTPVVRQPGTQLVNSFSWPPTGLPAEAALTEKEPNQQAGQIQQVTLPLDISGSFFPAADVDRFEFEAKKGEEWWIEVASERLGRPTDPGVVVMQVTNTPDGEVLKDVAEFSDIPSPVKVSSNGYAYDGPPYNAGTSDVMGKLTIPEDGKYRLQISDLFGGTRSDPRNLYRLVMRKAAPDFALVAWALHMELRNGDRNALSKPISLRGGSTMALEVVAIRRDGFNGDIDLVMEGLPEGVIASGLKIPAGQSRGMMLVTAKADAPRSFANASFSGRATIGDAVVQRPCRMASMAWPVVDAWGEFPSPRLITDIPVSVSGIDLAPLTVTPSQPAFEVAAGQKLTIPLTKARRSDFSGATAQMKTMGAGLDRVPQFDLTLTDDAGNAVIDTAALKTPPGEYLIAFYGGVVTKYRHHLEAIAIAQAEQVQAKNELEAANQALEAAKAASIQADATEATKAALAEATTRQQKATAALTAADAKVKTAEQVATPRDVVDIVVSEPITIRVKPAESK